MGANDPPPHHSYCSSSGALPPPAPPRRNMLAKRNSIFLSELGEFELVRQQTLPDVAEEAPSKQGAGVKFYECKLHVNRKWPYKAIFAHSGSKYYLVKSGTLDGLIEQCICPDKHLDDPLYKEIILEQYRLFTTKEKLAQQLLLSTRKLFSNEPNIMARFQSNREDVIRENVTQFVRLWKDQFPSDFNDVAGIEVLDRLILVCAFVNAHDLKVNLQKQKRLLNVKVKCFIEPAKDQNPKSTEKSEHSLSSELPDHLYPERNDLDPRLVHTVMNKPKKRPLLRSLSINSYTVSPAIDQSSPSTSPPKKVFCQHSPAEVAKLLTFKYSSILLDMPPYELAVNACSKLPEDAVLHRILSLNDEISEKVKSSIVFDVTMKSSKICAIIEFWLKVAVELLTLRNYECLQIIIHTIDSPFTDSKRLSDVWNHMNRSILKDFSRLKDIVSIDDNYQHLRMLQTEEEAKYDKMMSGSPECDQYKANSLKKRVFRSLSRKREDAESECKGWIPCLNLITKDIVAIKSASLLEKHDSGLINFAMHRKIHITLEQIRLAQRLLRRSLQLQFHEEIWTWFKLLPILTKEDILQNSSIISKR